MYKLFFEHSRLQSWKEIILLFWPAWQVFTHPSLKYSSVLYRCSDSLILMITWSHFNQHQTKVQEKRLNLNKISMVTDFQSHAILHRINLRIHPDWADYSVVSTLIMITLIFPSTQNNFISTSDSLSHGAWPVVLIFLY